MPGTYTGEIQRSTKSHQNTVRENIRVFEMSLDVFLGEPANVDALTVVAHALVFLNAGYWNLVRFLERETTTLVHEEVLRWLRIDDIVPTEFRKDQFRLDLQPGEYQVNTHFSLRCVIIASCVSAFSGKRKSVQ